MNMENLNLEALRQKGVDLAMAYLPKLALALVVLIVGLFIIGKIVRLLRSTLNRRDMDPSLAVFLGSLLSWLLKALLFISAASMVGVATTSFVAVLGAAGLALGLALQGSLANFAGGVLILLFKPFKTGDYIIAQGEEGSVKKIDVFATTLTKLDNRAVILPNGPLAGGTIVNVTAEPMRQVILSVGIDYNASIAEACKVLTAMCEKHPLALNEPKAFVGVTGYGDSSIDLTVRTWVKSADYWTVFFELNEQIKSTLDAANISIPFPQRDVHIFNEK